MQALVYEFPAASVESEDSMANFDPRIPNLEASVKALKTDVKELKEDVRSIKTDINTIKTEISSFKGATKVVGIIVGILAIPILTWASFITYNVIAMMNGGGTTKIVAELKAPKSPEQLQANLSTVIAQLQTASVNRTKPDEKKVRALSGALSQVVQHNQNLPEAWSATAELISYQSQALHPTPGHLPACNLQGVKPETRPSRTPTGALDYNPGFYLSNCALKLEDVPSLAVHEVPDNFGIKFINPTGKDSVDFPVYLTDGEVIYRGGAISHTIGFVFVNCIFDVRTEGIPDKTFRDVLIAALNSEDLVRVSAVSPNSAKPS